MLNCIYIALRAFASITILFLLTKLIGKRQISNLSFFDYINGITIGSIAAEIAVGLERNFIHGIVAMTVYSLTVYLINILSEKFLFAKRFFDGTPTLLFEDGVFFKNNFKRAHISINEFLEMCRVAGFHDISSINSAQLEPNGRLSIIPTAAERNVTLSDLGIAGKENYPNVNIIFDGRIIKDNLRKAGKNRDWVKKQLAAAKLHEKDIFYAFIDKSGKLNYFRFNQR